MPNVGAVFQPSFPPERLRSVVEAADEAGLSELWLWEDCFRESAFATAAAALAWSERLRVGIGIAPMPFRNVAATAMEIATIARIFPGRLLPGVGHGVLRWMDQIGARVQSPLTLMREYAPALRALLAGEEVSTSGRYVSLDRVKLDWPPAVVPDLLAAGEGPKTLALTGEVADGTILTGGTSVEGVARAASLIAEGRAAAGRDGRSPITVYVFAAFGGAAAREAVQAELAEWKLPTDQGLAAAGGVEEVAEHVARFHAAGADTVVLQPIATEPDPEEFVRRVAAVGRALA
ncbi:LLM class flavin-dependent oxidoreductase [Agromyces protaetiae]|uniref:LLM class flavin-dependent oxidoreductase n=1 Tax=Agromyces protaetiae TaxID=2509455 RepID=A0A4P6F8X6_9MICO|nr:LLM class flavin-dependent oxidoreductase [Agromyces protaetiae]QAY71986.1 LLM class flavin-dependent oxidoreductase [Agromyces protaetiae]